MKTEELISQLSNSPKVRRLRHPSYYGILAAAGIIAYGFVAQMFLGVRDDIVLRLQDPFFAGEIALLIVVAATGMFASILSAYPDGHRRQQWLRLPYIAAAGLIGVVFLQIVSTMSMSDVIAESNLAGMECAICIASAALVPSVLIFAFLYRGATISPLRAGAFAVMTAVAMAALALRIAEKTDSITHILEWHYAPAFIYALLGAWLGKILLDW